jgi:hypothetical protein
LLPQLQRLSSAFVGASAYPAPLARQYIEHYQQQQQQQQQHAPRQQSDAVHASASGAMSRSQGVRASPSSGSATSGDPAASIQQPAAAAAAAAAAGNGEPQLRMVCFHGLQYSSRARHELYDHQGRTRDGIEGQMMKLVSLAAGSRSLLVSLGGMVDVLSEPAAARSDVQTILRTASQTGCVPRSVAVVGMAEAASVMRTESTDGAALVTGGCAVSANKGYYSFIEPNVAKVICVDTYDFSLHQREGDSPSEREVVTSFYQRAVQSAAAGPQFRQSTGAVGVQQIQWLVAEIESALRADLVPVVLTACPMHASACGDPASLCWNYPDVQRAMTTALQAGKPNSVVVCVSGHDTDGGLFIQDRVIYVTVRSMDAMQATLQLPCMAIQVTKSALLLNGYDEQPIAIHFPNE